MCVSISKCNNDRCIISAAAGAFSKTTARNYDRCCIVEHLNEKLTNYLQQPPCCNQEEQQLLGMFLNDRRRDPN